MKRWNPNRQICDYINASTGKIGLGTEGGLIAGYLTAELLERVDTELAISRPAAAIVGAAALAIGSSQLINTEPTPEF